MFRILIAEDELIERMMLKKTLQKRFGDCCKILEAENGKTALRLFHEEEIDVALLDIEMPGIKGIDVAELMRKEKADLAIIFLTAYDKFEYARKAISVKAMEYLLKPYSERELIGVIQEALRIAANRRKNQDVPYEPPKYPEMTPADHDESTQQEVITEDGNLSRLNVLVAMVEEYIRSNYMNDISMQEAARAVNYSEPYFCKMFKQQFGQNFTAYLTEYRLEEAKKLLKQPNVSVKDIGTKVGYPDSSYFAKVFKRMTGASPSEYRSNVLKDYEGI